MAFTKCLHDSVGMDSFRFRGVVYIYKFRCESLFAVATEKISHHFRRRKCNPPYLDGFTTTNTHLLKKLPLEHIRGWESISRIKIEDFGQMMLNVDQIYRTFSGTYLVRDLTDSSDFSANRACLDDDDDDSSISAARFYRYPLPLSELEKDYIICKLSIAFSQNASILVILFSKVTAFNKDCHFRKDTNSIETSAITTVLSRNKKIKFLASEMLVRLTLSSPL